MHYFFAAIIFITLQQAFYVTSEDDPFVQVCAEVVNDPADLPGGQVFVATLQASPQSASLGKINFVLHVNLTLWFSKIIITSQNLLQLILLTIHQWTLNFHQHNW